MTRQGVREDYVPQRAPAAYDDRGQTDAWQREVYLNARRIADANGLRRIVDFGCGSGYKLIRYFGDCETTGIEIDPALAFVRDAYPDRTWIDGTAIGPDLMDGDLVVCSDVLEHLSEPADLLAAMAASTASVFVLSTPALEVLSDRGLSPRLGPPRNPTHVIEWTTAEFAALVGAHLDIVAHAIVNLSQATQLCVGIRKSRDTAITLPELIVGT